VDKLLIALGILAIVALLFALLARAWRARGRAQASLGTPPETPADLGRVALAEDLQYVATTFADRPLERILVSGLGFRARARITVAEAGIALDPAGGRTVFLPVADIRATGRATWTIDRVVNSDGLVFVRWDLNGTEVDSYLRSTDPDRLITALNALVPEGKP
jgi:hypothetical protein